jgi:hypothetical protein
MPEAARACGKKGYVKRLITDFDEKANCTERIGDQTESALP